MTGTCAAVTTPDTIWSFCPNLGADYLFIVLFALTTIAHIAQAITTRKGYCWVIITSGLAQFLAYVFRLLSVKNPTNNGLYAAWFVLILVAPLFTNAFVYMVMGRMVWNYVKNAKIYGITAWRFGLYFVILDVVALLVQILGAASATGTHQSQSAVLRALHIYMVGVGIQQFFICVFLVYAIKFHATTIQQNRQGHSTPQSAYMLLYAIYAVIILITVRIIFRLVEYSSGLHTSIPNHEAYQYCLDSVPMFIALVILNVYHPGRVMAGPASDIPSRKTRKNKAFRTKGQLAETHGNEDGLPMV
ncbi:hypothetical protein CJF32_00000283 [Rutstroemia sp. NJR-2017a WRK4]|nr:hypothetical protein CJF32_00000283 [Rutstroemia sp. NJR-2017a WRK4]